jgi:hypothetical protein
VEVGMGPVRIAVATMLLLAVAPQVVAAQVGKLSGKLILPPIEEPVQRPRTTPPVGVVEARNASFWANLHSVERGTSILVELKGGDWVRGSMESVDGAGLTIRIDRRLRTIAMEDVDRVTLTRSSAAALGIRGAMSGAGAGFLLSALAAESSHRVTVWRIKLVTGGALLGGLTGAVTGSAYRQVVVVYSSR